ncbi:lactosylceramide 4-alpha-galactosyltransferase-like [Rhynchophorus ferrugineus]|uniref:lactosylceramide 4-alpha-galactosyltransferase-like n=1 Tax=Rhynchophorus ferrugineus TaxID=354439 RepID=UPI003FCE5980
MYIYHIRLSKYRKRISLGIFLISVLIIVQTIDIPMPSILIKAYYWMRPEKSIYCHLLSDSDSLPDISSANPRKGRSIFFHETSCTSHLKGKITINARQACAVESAAFMNPNYEIYLLYASPGKIVYEGSESDRFISQLLKYPNIHIYHINMDNYMKNTMVENLWSEQKMFLSKFAQSHTSDVLRYLTLWKYGGIYLDLDVIVIKNLEDLGVDYAGLESDTSIAAGIMSFNYTGIGHEYATSCLKDLKENFNGFKWGHNGPGTITRLLKKLCQIENVSDMSGLNCEGFKVYPSGEFYAVPWWSWKWFFDEKYSDRVSACTNKSHIIHVWNKFSITYKIPLNSNIPYLQYASKYCPNIVGECDEFF